MRYYFYATDIYDTDFLHGNITTHSTVEQDIFGNTTSQTSSNAAVTTTVTNTFEKKDEWIKSRLCTTSTTTKRPPVSGTSFTQTTIFINNNIGQATNITQYGDDGTTGAITNLTYDPYGNVLSTTARGSAITTPRTTYYDYSNQPYARFVYAQNSGSQTVGVTSILKVYDDAYGNVTSEADINGLVTNHTYDGFGRLKITTTPTNQQIFVARSWDNTVTNGAFKTQTSTPGTASSTEYFDKLGRSLRAQTIGFDGTDVKADKTYNVLGQVTSQSEPFSGSAATLFTNYTYGDLFNRLSKVTLPSGSYTDYTYTGNSNTAVITQGAITKTVTKTLDESGALISSQDDGGTITYTYHSSGKPKTITVPGSTPTSMEYDVFGRQKTLADPDAGITQYQYDALGEFTKQTDAKGNVYDMEYDVLGRLTAKRCTTAATPPAIGVIGEVSYTYNASKPGLLDQITGTPDLYNGITYSYTYDNYNRLKTKTEHIIDETEMAVDYTSQYTYDALSRLTTETYPSGFIVKNDYNPYGYLETIKDVNDNSIWHCNTMNVRGQVTTATSGYGANTLGVTHGYSPLGYLQSTDVLNGSTNVWSMGYTFDPSTGDLSGRTRTVNSLTQSETFSYDNLDRLTDIYLNGSASSTQSTNYTPDGSGNIGAKGDVGSYVYASVPFRPHAVSAINTSLQPADQIITYTPFHKADRITQDAYSLQFSYGPDETRKKSVLTYSPPGTGSSVPRTVISVGNYEKIVTPTDKYEVHYISTPDGLAAIDVRTNGSATDEMKYVYTDHLGSINSIFDATKTKVYEQSFDAWGKERDPADWSLPPLGGAGGGPPDWLIRGYTGHEHHKEFGLINMNGRMYDPLLGRMLSPDNQVQAADFTQSYNKYSYVMNNPLKYTDPSGMAYYRGNISTDNGADGPGDLFAFDYQAYNQQIAALMTRGGSGGSFDYEKDDIPGGLDAAFSDWNAQAAHAAEAIEDAQRFTTYYDVKVGDKVVGTYNSKEEAEQVASGIAAARAAQQSNLYASLNGGGLDVGGILPSWSSMSTNYPKNSEGGDMPASDVYEMVGGQIYNMYLSDPSSYANACALRVSYALNKSGVSIPDASGTFTGGDGGNYFLSASKLNSWMTSYFGSPNLSVRSNFESSLQGNQGIYIMIPNYPGKFGASGHATLFDGSNAIGNHNYYNATGGVYQINLWILK
ncbi:MAG: hypothetical protein HY840_02385 [Bacteroidetes bacterium]|nr:hypothetical protein [Bacteroidota bacterium]